MPVDQCSAADPEPEAEPSVTTSIKRNRNNRWRNKRDPISKDWQGFPQKDHESTHEAKENTSDGSLAQPGDRDDVENGDPEDELGSDWEVMKQKKLKASPNGGKEKPIVVNSAPNGGNLKAAKGGW